MPVDDTKKVDQREWPLEPVDGEAVKLVVTHTTTTKDVGTPSETVTHRWEAEVSRARTKLLVCSAPTQPEMDTALNTLRQAVVDARALLPAMA